MLAGLVRGAQTSPDPKGGPASPAIESKRAAEPDRAAPRKALEPAEVATRMEAAFSREVADHEWSTKAQQTTQQKISALMPNNSEVLSVDCRTSLCRVEMTHQSLDDYRRFLDSAYMQPESHLWDGPSFSTLLENSGSGPVVAVSFLFREGQSPPNMTE
jgi:hypothetical protein